MQRTIHDCDVPLSLALYVSEWADNTPEAPN